MRGPVIDHLSLPSNQIFRSPVTLMSRRAALLLVFCLAAGCRTGEHADLHIAVASNFAVPIEHLVAEFEKQTGGSVAISVGSTGGLYAQIRNGAPFDVFLAADVNHPALLEQEGVGVPETRFTYARGKLVLWSPKPDFVKVPPTVLGDSTFRFLAIANPELAPYGAAAREVLERMNLWEALADRIVTGENIGQTFQFVRTGNADLGFVAYSQLSATGDPIVGSYWLVPARLYSPIDQQAILLRRNQVARDFLEFLRDTEALTLIHEFGYDTP